MRSGSGTRKTAARRFATVMAAVGALLVSSGIALMAAPMTASAVQYKNTDHKVVICHGTSSEGNPYVGISIDKHAVQAHQSHSHVWAGDTWWHGVFHKDGSVKMDVLAVPGATEDAQLAYCNAPSEEAPVATATATPNTPTCANNVPSYTRSGTYIESTWLESAPPAFGTTITVTATAVEGAKFAGGASTKAISVTFPPAATGCGAVSPPTSQVSPPKAQVEAQVKAKTQVKAETTTPTVVHAGLAGTASGTSVATGLGLTLAGLVLMAGAGGLALEGGERKETT